MLCFNNLQIKQKRKSKFSIFILKIDNSFKETQKYISENYFIIFPILFYRFANVEIGELHK